MKNSQVPIQKWLYATYVIASSTMPVSVTVLCRSVDIKKRAAENMLRTLRENMGFSGPQLSGVVAIDETEIKCYGREKIDVIGMVEVRKVRVKTKDGSWKIVNKTGRAALVVLTRKTHKQMLDAIVKNVAKGTTVYTDSHQAYGKLPGLGYNLQKINRSKAKRYRQGFKTNPIEGLWGNLKRYLALYHGTKKENLQLYLDEFSFKHNRQDNYNAISDDLIKRLIHPKKNIT